MLKVRKLMLPIYTSSLGHLQGPAFPEEEQSQVIRTVQRVLSRICPHVPSSRPDACPHDCVLTYSKTEKIDDDCWMTIQVSIHCS